MKIYEVVLRKKWDGSPNDVYGIIGFFPSFGRKNLFLNKAKALEKVVELLHKQSLSNEREQALWKMQGYSYEVQERDVIE